MKTVVLERRKDAFPLRVVITLARSGTKSSALLRHGELSSSEFDELRKHLGNVRTADTYMRIFGACQAGTWVWWRR